MSRFTLRITVGAVVEEGGKILVVREMRKRMRTDSPTIFTQPAGHLEEGESLLEGLVREVREETGYEVRPISLIGIYQQRFPDSSSLRFSFVCERVSEEQAKIEDPDILEAVWMPVEEIKARRDEYRVGATAATFDDYFAGKRYSLDILRYADFSTIDDEAEETPLVITTPQTSKNAS